MSPRSHRALAVALALLGTCGSFAMWPSASDAQVTPEGDRLEKARKAMEEGQGLYSEKKYEEEAKAFAKAYSIQPYAAFLFNEGVCHEKLGDFDQAALTFRRYLNADPNAPDADAVKARLKRIEQERDAKKTEDAGVDAGAPAPTPAGEDAIRSLLLVETEPAGAPAEVWERVDPQAAAFRKELDNKGWKQISAGTTPLAVTLSAGKFHIVVDKFRSYNRSETNLDVLPGHVHHFKANLSQGAFMAFLRVESPVKNAAIYLDDDAHEKPPWGVAPHAELVPLGEHVVSVEAPGFEPWEKKVTLEAGQQAELTAELDRVSYGYLLFDGNAGRIEVKIDGQPVGVVDPEAPLKVKQPKGKHHVVAEAEGKKKFEDDIEVPAGQSRDVHIVFVNKFPRGNAWGAAITSAALIGGGVVLGLEANHTYDNLKNDRAAGVLAGDDERGNHGKLFAYGSNGAFALGGLFAVFAVYEFVRDPLPPSGAGVDDPREFDGGKKRSAFSLSPSFGATPSGGSMLLRGTF